METIDLDERFDYHAPDDATGVLHQDVRTGFKALAQYVMETVPSSRERSLVLTKLEEALFWANAAIARS